MTIYDSDLTFADEAHEPFVLGGASFLSDKMNCYTSLRYGNDLYFLLGKAVTSSYLGGFFAPTPPSLNIFRTSLKYSSEVPNVVERCKVVPQVPLRLKGTNNYTDYVAAFTPKGDLLMAERFNGSLKDGQFRSDSDLIVLKWDADHEKVISCETLSFPADPTVPDNQKIPTTKSRISCNVFKRACDIRMSTGDDGVNIFGMFYSKATYTLRTRTGQVSTTIDLPPTYEVYKYTDADGCTMVYGPEVSVTVNSNDAVTVAYVYPEGEDPQIVQHYKTVHSNKNPLTGATDNDYLLMGKVCQSQTVRKKHYLVGACTPPALVNVAPVWYDNTILYSEDLVHWEPLLHDDGSVAFTGGMSDVTPLVTDEYMYIVGGYYTGWLPNKHVLTLMFDSSGGLADRSTWRRTSMAVWVTDPATVDSTVLSPSTYVDLAGSLFLFGGINHSGNLLAGDYTVNTGGWILHPQGGTPNPDVVEVTSAEIEDAIDYPTYFGKPIRVEGAAQYPVGTITFANAEKYYLTYEQWTWKKRVLSEKRLRVNTRCTIEFEVIDVLPRKLQWEGYFVYVKRDRLSNFVYDFIITDYNPVHKVNAYDLSGFTFDKKRGLSQADGNTIFIPKDHRTNFDKRFGQRYVEMEAGPPETAMADLQVVWSEPLLVPNDNGPDTRYVQVDIVANTVTAHRLGSINGAVIGDPDVLGKTSIAYSGCSYKEPIISSSMVRDPIQRTYSAGMTGTIYVYTINVNGTTVTYSATVDKPFDEQILDQPSFPSLGNETQIMSEFTVSRGRFLNAPKGTPFIQEDHKTNEYTPKSYNEYVEPANSIDNGGKAKVIEIDGSLYFYIFLWAVGSNVCIMGTPGGGGYGAISDDAIIGVIDGNAELKVVSYDQPRVQAVFNTYPGDVTDNAEVFYQNDKGKYVKLVNWHDSDGNNSWYDLSNVVTTTGEDVKRPFEFLVLKSKAVLENSTKEIEALYIDSLATPQKYTIDSDKLPVKDGGPLVDNHPVHIIKWLIDNYTYYITDDTSFAEVEADMERYYDRVTEEGPHVHCDYIFTGEKNAFDAVVDIAGQFLTGIVIDGHTVKLTFLPNRYYKPKNTINKTNVELDSVEISTQRREDIYNKMVARWKKRQTDTESTVTRRFPASIRQMCIMNTEVDLTAIRFEHYALKYTEFWGNRQALNWTVLKFNYMGTDSLDIFGDILVSRDVLNAGAVDQTPYCGMITDISFDPVSHTTEVTAILSVQVGSDFNNYRNFYGMATI